MLTFMLWRWTCADSTKLGMWKKGSDREAVARMSKSWTKLLLSSMDHASVEEIMLFPEKHWFADLAPLDGFPELRVPCDTDHGTFDLTEFYQYYYLSGNSHDFLFFGKLQAWSEGKNLKNIKLLMSMLDRS